MIACRETELFSAIEPSLLSEERIVQIRIGEIEDVLGGVGMPERWEVRRALAWSVFSFARRRASEYKGTFLINTHLEI